VVGFCEHGNEPSFYIKKVAYSSTSWVTVNFSKNIQHHGVSVFTVCWLVNNEKFI
jgi:hypothetical protein